MSSVTLTLEYSLRQEKVTSNITLETFNKNVGWTQYRVCLNLILNQAYIYITKIFRTHTNGPWGPPSFLYNGYRVISKGKAEGTWR